MGRHGEILCAASSAVLRRFNHMEVPELIALSLANATEKVSRGFSSDMSLKPPVGEIRTPTCPLFQTSNMRSAVSVRKRARFHAVPPYSSVRRFDPVRRNWSIKYPFAP